jgi:hypothetical protein
MTSWESEGKRRIKSLKRRKFGNSGRKRNTIFKLEHLCAEKNEFRGASGISPRELKTLRPGIYFNHLRGR